MHQEQHVLRQGLLELASDTSVGQRCCENMVSRLGRLLGVRYVFVGVVDPGEDQTVHSLATAIGGALSPGFSYDLSGSPCERIVGKRMCVYSGDVCAEFPQDALLREMGVSSYLGAPIFDTRGEGIGLLDDKLLPDSAELRTLVQMHAARAGVEIDRMRYEQRLESLSASLTQEVARQTAHLEEANRQLASFAYSVSHDLRTPLRHMMGYGELMLGLDSVGRDPEARRCAEAVLQAGSKMAIMMEALLDHASNYQAEPRCQWVDLSALIADIASQLVACADRPPRLDSPDEARVWADPALIRIVLQNLLGNAIKYSSKHPHPRVSVGFRAGTDQDEIVVEDNGIGFDMKQADRLFGVFQRLHAESDFPGHGIGLANALGIVRRHGGQIGFHSRPNEGARFVVSLPRPPQPRG
jgi:signal transduction histidine kinase